MWYLYAQNCNMSKSCAQYIEGAGEDFISTTCLITFGAESGPGSISPSCDIIIINDLIIELDETFSLSATIINSNGQAAQFTADGESASATIIDDDGMMHGLYVLVFAVNNVGTYKNK